MARVLVVMGQRSGRASTGQHRPQPVGFLDHARHELALTRIAAPIGGRVHEVRVSVGDRVAAAPDGRVLVTIVAPGAVYAAATAVES